jgi:hypothetical protein
MNPGKLYFLVVLASLAVLAHDGRPVRSEEFSLDKFMWYNWLAVVPRKFRPEKMSELGETSERKGGNI